MKDLILPNTCINFHVIHDREWFEMVVRLLKQMYTIVSLEDLHNYYYDKRPLKNACHITFDDGDKSVYEKAFPILEKYNVPASIYVSPKAIVEQQNFWFQEIRGYDVNELKKILLSLDLFENDISDSYLKSLLKKLQIDMIWEVIYRYRKVTNTNQKPCVNMNKSQLLELHQSGLVEIGAHTLDHPILMNETDERAATEIGGSIDWLSDILNNKIIHFAYPNGRYDEDFDEREMAILKSKGIQLSFTTDKGIVSKNNNKLKIPRNGLTKGGKMHVLVKLMMGSKWDDYKRIIHQIRK